MTGRELIIYILENHLEEEEIFKDDKITFEDEINNYEPFINLI